ncbi:MAG: histidinol dehydrogenase [Polyangia bacterium]|jgi:phosphoribosyl-ATP pyrophosphohydrolase/phosphoribosyl-AMP cyclohydrolase/histidinol dehydrogenase|nr:histidinol dehydrogenase [Polyangia bacterium]
MTVVWPRVLPREVPALGRQPVDAETLGAAARIVEDVRQRGEQALREHAERLGDLGPGDPLVLGPEALARALSSLPAEERGVLERTASRIRAFAEAQRASLADVDMPVPGGRAGHRVVPVDSAGCYAPGGRYPLPSSVLMTAVTARVAGVGQVWVASPRPAPATLAAAAISGADALLCVGGAQAIAALAFGAGPVPACDAVVGPGNRWVTAAKQLVAGRVAIDLLAGPSELVVLADGSADPDTVAADLLAQAEHDPDARPILVALDAGLEARVRTALEVQLAALPTRSTAEPALAGGFSVLAPDLGAAVELCNRLAPEHLELWLPEPELQTAIRGLRHYGGLFIGGLAAEVLGDYGAGPNHTLPTGGTARSTAGLSVFTFLRALTWLRVEDHAGAQPLVEDAVALARMEGLVGHARAALRRKT